MKINVYGFGFKNAPFPKAMRVGDVFEYMQKTSGADNGKLYRFAASKLTRPDGSAEKDWWGGMILKFRNANAFTKLKQKDGKTVVTSETLAAGERLVELTHFIAHTGTGNGLIAHHYLGTSLYAFAVGCSRTFSKLRAQMLAEACKQKEADEIKKIKESFKGKLELSQLCMDTDIKTLVKRLKNVNSFELTVSTLETQEKLFRGIIEKSKHQTIKVTFPPDLSVDELADDADAISKMATVEDIKVSGKDEHKVQRNYFSGKNPLIFSEVDYDEVMNGVELNLDDWTGSIEKSKIIKYLIGVAEEPSTHKMLVKMR